MCESVDAGDDLRGIFAETVEDYAEGFFAGLVGGFCKTDCAFRSGERFVTGAECKAFGAVFKKHGSEVAVTETDFAVICDGTGNAEGLETFTESLGDFGSNGLTALDGDSRADEVSPAGIFKADRLNVFDALIDVETFVLADLFGFFNGGDSVVVQKLVDLIDTAFIAFKQWHGNDSSYALRGLMTLAASPKRPYVFWNFLTKSLTGMFITSSLPELMASIILPRLTNS